MNIKQKKLLTIALALFMLAAVFIPVTINQRGMAAWSSGPINSCYKVNTSSGLAIKSSASASSSTLATIPNGTMIFVLNINSAGTWGYTGYNGKYGYVNLSGAQRKASGPSTAEELLQRMQAVMQFYPATAVWKGSKNNSSKGQYITNYNSNGSSTCFGFASEVWRALFGTEMAQAYYASQMYVLRSDPDMKLVGTITNCDDTKVKNLISKARCGDIIQASQTNSSGQHTMVVYSTDDSGVWIYDANRGGGNKVRLEYFTWAKLAADRPGGMSLYTSSEYPPDAKAVIMGSGITLKNSSGAVSTSYMVSDRINMSATVSNATSIVFYIVNKNTGAVVHQSSSLTKAEYSYTFTSLNNGATAYQVYYVAKNDKNTFTSSKTDITVKMPTISVSNNSATIETTQSVALGGRVSKSPSSVRLSWMTSDHNIATVDANGNVTGRKAGKVTITVTATYTGTSGSVARVSATFTITVLNPKYTVSFNSNGGEGSFAAITVEKTKQYGTLPTPTRLGYTFDGWYTAASGGTKIVATSIVSISSNITLYAHWKANSYTVTLDHNDGTNKKTTIKATYDSAISSLPTASRPGYVFEGWFTAQTGGTKVTTSTVYKVTGESKYYAQWSLATFTVTFDAVGGTVSPASTKVTYTKLFGELPTPTRTGYTFQGWFTQKNGAGTQVLDTTTVEITSNTTLYAYWIGNKYIVSFDSNGSVDTFEDREVVFGSSYGSLPMPEIPGYAFVGWYTEKDGGQLVNLSTNVFIPSDHVLYAHWEPGEFVVSFDANGGETPTPNKTVIFMTTYGELPIPTREGYTFIGWYDSLRPDAQQIIDSTTVTIVANQKLYAHWSVNTYTIGFITNCPESFDSKEVEFDTEYGTLPVPTKKGYTFLGWFTPEDRGAEFVTEQSILKIGMDFALEAHWRANTYTITFDPSNGTVDVTSKIVEFDKTYGELPIPERFGYNFMGWYTQSKGGELIEVTTIVSYDTNMVIYARWSARKIMVTFDPNGGVCVKEYEGYDFDLPFGTLPTPEKRGYTFTGWKTEDGEILTVDRVIDFINDIVVVAQWRANDYNIQLNANGGSFANQDSVVLNHTVTFDSTYPMLATPSKHGYRFVGWITVDGNHAYTGDKVDIVSDQTFVADWAPLVHVITLDAKGGSLEVGTVKAYYGMTYSNLPVPVKKGYTFTGWVNKDGNLVTSSTVVKTTDDEVFTATWTEKVYEISFNANGGTLENSSTISVTFGGTYGELPVPTRVGYKFARWEDTNGNYIYEGDAVTVTENVVYYAKWIPLVFDVYFDGKGSHMTVPPITAVYDSTYNVLPDIERNGYIFLGWYDKNSNLITEDSIVKLTESITLVARWQAVEYSIVFDANGGECSMQNMNFTFDSMAALPVPVKTGSVFLGWYTENGEVFSEDTSIDSENVNRLTAGWALSEYSIRFNIQGKINNSFTKTVIYNDRIGMLQDAMVPGYDFLYWLDSNGNIITSESIYTDTFDIVLYAELLPRTYTVTFLAPDAEPEYTEKTVTNEDLFGELPQTVKHGYVLMGWFAADGTRITEDSVVMLTEDTVLTAKWAKVESNADGVFSNNSLLSTSCEIIGLVDLVLLVLAMIRRKKKIKV